MSSDALLDILAAYQHDACQMLARRPELAHDRQYHPDLSPLGWHVGHCAFIETYWLRERLLNDDSATAALHGLYFPDMAEKPGRGARLPEREALLEWASRLQRENLELMARLSPRDKASRLMRDDFLPRFLIQHYAQHLEIMDMIRTQARADEQTPLDAVEPLVGGEFHMPEMRGVPSGTHRIGGSGAEVYDNEATARLLHLDDFRIARRPVTNSQYLAAMDDGLYHRRALWSRHGWRWREAEAATHPEHWRPHPDGGWYALTATGPASLEADAAVSGLSRHEAEAFARWAGARLPHEYEWEAAARHGALEDLYGAWEWCDNPFHPYPGFVPFPYDGYSLPWFDGRHFVLRGGSPQTREPIRRHSFRNFYTADKRHIFAGIRLAHY